MSKVLVTGGCGYIGSHTIVDLVNNGYQVISVDNFSNSNPFILERINDLCNRPIFNYNIDLTSIDDCRKIFTDHPDLCGIIHFAAFKSVPESVEKPLLYYYNNLLSLQNLLQLAFEFKVNSFVFSSSCSVYGNADQLPVTESTPIKHAESPYAFTKQIGEQMIRDFYAVSKLSYILLRYFNPVGAHVSSKIGELPIGPPLNLVPRITRTAIGKLTGMTVYGNDYPTRDGSNIRDYIHVMDIAHAHTLALQFVLNKGNITKPEVFNLGTGNGITTLEVIHAFEKVSGFKLDYKIGERRAGDVVAIYADNQKAKSVLGWSCKFTLEDMMKTAWDWELSLR